MKKLSIALFILIVTVCRVQAAGPALYLSDRDGTVLDVMNRDGFFSDWAQVFYGQQPGEGGYENAISLSAEKPEGSWAAFRLEAGLPGGSIMVAEWTYADREHFDDMAENSIHDILGLARAARVDGLHRAITGKALSSNVRIWNTPATKTGWRQIIRLSTAKYPLPDTGSGVLWAKSFSSVCAEKPGTGSIKMPTWRTGSTSLMEKVKNKFMDGWSLDTNNFRTNTIYHMYAGALYYQTARSNGYGFFASTAFSFMGSLFWEYLGEWREQVSTNDMIFTPFAGSLMGEGFTQIALFAQEEIESPFLRYPLVLILDPMRIVNNYLDSLMDGDFRVHIHFTGPAQIAADRYLQQNGNPLTQQ
jgi:hypothetical protein